MNLLMQPKCRLAPRIAMCLAIIATTGVDAAQATLSPDSTERPESQQEYWAQFDQHDWEAAAEAARKLVEVAREKAKQKPLELAEALSLLGNAQRGLRDYDAAEVTYAEALEIVEANSGSMSSNLLEPLQGMGLTLAGRGDHDKAVPYLDRALLISHRNYGLFDAAQQPLLRQLATSLAQTGRLPEAERHMLYLQRVGERAYGRRDPRIVPIMLIVGDWYAEYGMFVPARLVYRDAIDIVERKLGTSDLGVVEPLRHLARSYTKEVEYSTRGLATDRSRPPTDADGTSNEFKSLNPRYIDSDGEKALERALKVLASHQNPPRRTLVETLVQTGDWFQVKAQSDKALAYYRRAAALATQGPDDADSEPAILSFPVRVYYPAPTMVSRNAQLPADQTEEKYVQVQFTVTDAGDVANARVIDQNGTARQASEFLQAIRGSRYRPKFVNGEPVETPGVTTREVFKVRKQSEEKES
jgi:tetratricopeptide (TPR) repeat protein